jgi:hypothetical protein
MPPLSQEAMRALALVHYAWLGIVAIGSSWLLVDLTDVVADSSRLAAVIVAGPALLASGFVFFPAQSLRKATQSGESASRSLKPWVIVAHGLWLVTLPVAAYLIADAFRSQDLDARSALLRWTLWCLTSAVVSAGALLLARDKRSGESTAFGDLNGRLPDLDQRVQCPQCGEFIRIEAAICEWCKADLPAGWHHTMP